ncbi:MAG: S41 family peptidase [Rhodobacteraceae bacterium]|nr:S41 family peptidase [Paracoccaceae bacterium]
MRFLAPIALFAGAAILSSVWLMTSSTAQEDSESTVYEALDLFSRAFQIARNEYVEEIGDLELVQGAVQGMLSSLDPHSSYLSPERMDSTKIQTTGEFGGLGIEVSMENGWIKVVSPIDDTPAAKAGVRAGDYITELDGESVLGLTLEEAVEIMRGPVGEKIVLTIEREGEDGPIEVEIIRDIIELTSVKARMVSDIMVVRVIVFSENTHANLAEAMAEQAEEAGGMDSVRGVVLDLRNNPGGVLTSAVDISDAFLERGDIVLVRGRQSGGTSNYTAEAGDLAEGKPMAVLINIGSASGSEIVAGALQDHKRAVVIGTQSYGKGSVQEIINLGPEHGGIKLTTARYYTPAGRSIQGEGIVPDIYVQDRRTELIDDEDPEAGVINEAKLRNSLESENPDDEEAAEADAEKRKVIEELRLTDPQLSHAIDVLTAVDIFRQQ